MNCHQNVIYVDSAPINYTISENQQVSVLLVRYRAILRQGL